MNFFYKESKSKIKKLVRGRRGEGGGGAGVSDFFLTKSLNIFFLGGGRGEG